MPGVVGRVKRTPRFDARGTGLLHFARNDGERGAGLLHFARNDRERGAGLLRFARNDGRRGDWIATLRSQ